MKICLVGLGISNREMINLLTDQGNTVYLSNNSALSISDKNFLDNKNISYEEFHGELLKSCDLAILSPGIPPDSDAAKIIFGNKIRYTTEIEYAWTHIKRFNREAVFIGVTGTNGKTTTTSLIGHVIREIGYPCFIGGNIGVPLVSAPVNLPYYVLEISSFQMFWTTKFFPEISILINLAPDHLNWHRNIEEYYGCKKEMILRTLKAGGVGIINENTDINYSGGHKILFSKDFIDNGIFSFSDLKIKIKNDFLNMDIYKENTVAAILTLLNMGFGKDLVENSLSSFKAPSHRIEFCGKKAGIKYYDDSKATNVHAAINAYRSFRNTNYIAILSGVPKNEDMSELISELEKFSKKTIVFGDMEKEIKKYKIPDNFLFVNSLEESLKVSKDFASEGDCVILSPSGASFDKYKSYKERGDHFKSLVDKL